MNSKIVAVLLTNLLLIDGLNAQEIARPIDAADGLVDVNDGVVAPEAPALVLHVPVSLNAIRPVAHAYVHCSFSLRRDTEQPTVIYRHRNIPLTDNGYEGVVSFYLERSLLLAHSTKHLTSYYCRLIFCAPYISTYRGQEFPGLTGLAGSVRSSM